MRSRWELHYGYQRAVTLAALLLIYCQIQGTSSLVGDNVCKEEQTYNITKRIRYELPVTIRKYEWCLAIPPRCSRYHTEMQEATKMETEKHVEEIEVCCTGFQQRGQRCVPRCPAGRTGEKCDKECSPSKWGASCSRECSCPERSSCDTRNGKCICHEGWGGQRCDKEIDLSTPSRPIAFDKNLLEWGPEIAFTTETFESTTISVSTVEPSRNKKITFATSAPATKHFEKSLKNVTNIENNFEELTNQKVNTTFIGTIPIMLKETVNTDNYVENIKFTPIPNIVTQIANPPLKNNIEINNKKKIEMTVNPIFNRTMFLNNNNTLQNITNIPNNNNKTFQQKIRNNTSNIHDAINTAYTTTNLNKTTRHDITTENTRITTVKIIKNNSITTQTPITRIKIMNISESISNLNVTQSKNITFISPIYKFTFNNTKTVGTTSPDAKDSQNKDTTITYISPSPKFNKNFDIEGKIKYTSSMKKVTTPSSISIMNLNNKTTMMTVGNLKEISPKINRKLGKNDKTHSSTTNSLDSDEVHILTEPEHITSVASDRGFESSGDNLISVLSLVCGGAMTLIMVAVFIVMVERRRNTRSEDINGSKETIEEIEGGEAAPIYMRSIFNSPLPDPPCEEKIKRSEVQSFHGHFLRPVVIHAISPIMVENFRGILESHYDHLPPRNLRPQSWFREETPPSMMHMSNYDNESTHKNPCNNNFPVTESSIDTLKLENSITNVEDTEPVYDEIPFWRPPSQHAIEVVNLNGEAVTEL